MGETAHQQTRAAIPNLASLRVDPERLQRLWAMRPAERVAAAQAGRFTLGEMLRWASKRPAEVPLVDGEWFFISAFLADSREASRHTSRAWAAAAEDPSSRRSQ